jgi:hypothetical protein
MENKTINNQKLFTAIILILIAGATRFISIPGIGQFQNFTAIGGLAIFSSAYFKPYYKAVLITFLAYFLSDILLNLYVYKMDTAVYGGSFIQYGAMALVAIIGYFANKKPTLLTIFSSSMLGSILFFVITNFGVWASGTMYTKDFAGLLTCYTAGIPFFTNFSVSTVLSAGIMYYIYIAVAQRRPIAIA